RAGFEPATRSPRRNRSIQTELPGLRPADAATSAGFFASRRLRLALQVARLAQRLFHDRQLALVDHAPLPDAPWLVQQLALKETAYHPRLNPEVVGDVT